MGALRTHFAVGLMLVMFMLNGPCSQNAPFPTPPVDVGGGVEAKQDVRRMVELVKHSRSHHGVNTTVVFPGDVLRKKDKFIEYITGPLYFRPSCKKIVYRLYHHTRDCKIPAYFKRCAQLLIRLAGSPQCTAG